MGSVISIKKRVIGLLPHELRRGFRGDYWLWLLWFGFSMVADFCFGYVARRTLLTEFRELATQRFQPKPSWWQRWFGKG